MDVITKEHSEDMNMLFTSKNALLQFGCGCVPSIQTNMLHIPFNANNLRATVFFALTIILSVWSMVISKTFDRKAAKILYCSAVVLLNVILAVWVVKAFMWA